MKKSILILIFIIASVGCQKDQFQQDAKVDSEILRELSAKKTENERKLIYKTLNEYEKSEFWKNKISLYINSSITKNKRILLSELISAITPEIFRAKNEPFLSYSEKWLNRASHHFTKSELNYIVVSLNINDVKVAQVPGEGGARTDCGCKVTNTVLTLCGGIWSASEECKEGNCTETSEFCGFLLLERCNGKCTIAQPQ